MIVVSELIKSYSGFKAVDGIGFSISPGEVTGFLGPNGAGKTTTLRMLTGYLAPTSGEISIFGKNPLSQPLECKSIIGYLPENNPLYEEMEVHEFIDWCAEMRGFSGKEKDDAVSDAIAKCRLENAVGKPISHLSKGYKQRVGLAKAIVHNPKVLFLDEPTSGLDPNQAKDVRNLILELKKEKTIFLSTHILTEAEAICDKVILIHRGRIAARGSIPEIVASRSGGRAVIIRFSQDVYARAAEILSRVPGAEKAEISEKPEKALRLFTSDRDRDLRPAAFDICVKEKLPLLELYEEKISFERIFREITS